MTPTDREAIDRLKAALDALGSFRHLAADGSAHLTGIAREYISADDAALAHLESRLVAPEAPESALAFVKGHTADSDDDAACALESRDSAIAAAAFAKGAESKAVAPVERVGQERVPAGLLPDICGSCDRHAGTTLGCATCEAYNAAYAKPESAKQCWKRLDGEIEQSEEGGVFLGGHAVDILESRDSAIARAADRAGRLAVLKEIRDERASLIGRGEHRYVALSRAFDAAWAKHTAEGG